MGAMDQFAGKRFTGYLVMRLPHELDEVVTAAVAGYRRADPAARRATAESVQPRAAGVLSAYGQRMAAMAVRTGSKEPLLNALVGVGLAQARLQDPRGNLIVLAAVNHAADTVVGQNALGGLVDEVAGVLPAASATVLRTFADRPAHAKSLPSMGLQGWGDREHFLYVSGPTTPA